jgi:hypothetical protein
MQRKFANIPSNTQQKKKKKKKKKKKESRYGECVPCLPLDTVCGLQIEFLGSLY